MGQRQAREGNTVDGYERRDGQVTTETVSAATADGVGVTRPRSGNGAQADPGASPGAPPATAGARNGDGDGVRRALIRATLTHPAGAPPPPREPPLFTMHQQSGRGNTGNTANVGNTANAGNTWGGQQPRKAGRGRGGQSRSFKDGRAAGGQPGNSYPSGNQARPDGRPGSKPRSSRRGRGRSR